jgi:hypothetical protein
MNHLYSHYTAADLPIWGAKTPRLIKWPWLDLYQVVTVKTVHKNYTYFTQTVSKITACTHAHTLTLTHTHTYILKIIEQWGPYIYVVTYRATSSKKQWQKRWEINNGHCLHIPRFTSAKPASSASKCSSLEPNFRRNRNGTEEHHLQGGNVVHFTPDC